MHHVRLRNVARMRKIAKSATASVEAAALALLGECLGENEVAHLLQYTMPVLSFSPSSDCNARKLTSLSKNINISPIEPSSSRSEDFATCWHQRNKFLVPSTHLASSVPKWSEDCREVTPSLFLQSFHKFISLTLF